MRKTRRKALERRFAQLRIHSLSWATFHGFKQAWTRRMPFHYAAPVPGKRSSRPAVEPTR